MFEYLLCCLDLIVYLLQKPANRWGAFLSLPVFTVVGLLVPTLLYILLSQLLLMLLLTYIKPTWIVEFMHWTNLRKNGYTAKFETVGGFTFCYAEKGIPSEANPSLLLFHGLSGTKDMWFPMPAVIPPDRHVILLDMPGHGGSTKGLEHSYSFMDQASRIAQFVIATGLNRRPFHLVGISMGGGVAVAYAALYPKDVSKLSLLCPAGLVSHEKSEYLQDIDRGLIKADSGKMPINATEQHKAFPYLFHIRKGVKVPRLYSWLAFEILKTKRLLHCKVAKDLDDDVESKILLEYIPKIQAPTQVIWGKFDRLLHPSGAEILKASLPDCEVHMLARCGHTISFDRPFKAMKLILEFGSKK